MRGGGVEKRKIKGGGGNCDVERRGDGDIERWVVQLLLPSKAGCLSSWYACV